MKFGSNFGSKTKSSALFLGLTIGWMAVSATPASATTLVGMNLDELVASNRNVALVEVTEAVSRWNADGTFMLTDVTLQPIEVLKGDDIAEYQVTLMGGTIGDLTTLIVGGAELLPGRAYVVFLDRTDLPGAPQVTTVRDHGQAVFAIGRTKDGSLRAVSQAKDHPLIAGPSGITAAPGGTEGFALDALLDEIREAVRSQAARKEGSQ